MRKVMNVFNSSSIEFYNLEKKQLEKHALSIGYVGVNLTYGDDLPADCPCLHNLCWLHLPRPVKQKEATQTYTTQSN